MQFVAANKEENSDRINMPEQASANVRVSMLLATQLLLLDDPLRQAHMHTHKAPCLYATGVHCHYAAVARTFLGAQQFPLHTLSNDKPRSSNC